jgi:hypothetical protein
VQAAAAMTPEPTPTPTATPVATVTPTPTPPPDKPKAAAKLTGVKVSGRLRTSRSKLRIKFTLTAAATVRFTVTKHGATKPLGTWTRRAEQGTNAVTLTTRLPTHRTLRNGSYRLVLRLASSARGANFRVG